MITTIAFDMGGVVFEIDRNRAVEHFTAVGVAQAAHLLDDFEQVGIFGEVESGAISDEEFRARLSEMAGVPLTWEQCQYGWTGYVKQLHGYAFDGLEALRRRGYRLCLLTNTNPFMMSWTRSEAFDGRGHGIEHYFERVFASYEMKVMKPDPRIFTMMLEGMGVSADETLFVDDSARNCSAAAALGIHTLQPANGADWRADVDALLAQVQ